MIPSPAFPGLRRAAGFCLAGSALLALLALGRIFGWQDRAPVAGWMTPRFVMLAHALTEADLKPILGPGGMAPGRTLARIAADRGDDPATLVAAVEAAAMAIKAAGE